MPTIGENMSELAQDLTSIRTALNGRGWTIPQGMPLSKWADVIDPPATPPVQPPQQSGASPLTDQIMYELGVIRDRLNGQGIDIPQGMALVDWPEAISVVETQILAVNVGGPAVSGTSWIADNLTWTGWNMAATNSNSVDLSQTHNPAPLVVYQSLRYGAAGGNFSCTLSNLTAGTQYKVRFHFAEDSVNAPNVRLMNLSLNGTVVLSGVDLFALGGLAVAVVLDAAATAQSNGTISVTVAATTGQSPVICGIEVLE
jgi:hypothetical protein